MIGTLVALLIILASLLANFISPYSPSKIDFTNMIKPPSKEHLFGTDKMGRDVFTQLLYGGRISIYVSVAGAVLGSTIGMMLGCIAGWFGGKLIAY